MFQHAASDTRPSEGLPDRFSKDTLDRLAGLARSINATDENALAYLLDFHEKASAGDIAGQSPREACPHACIEPEIWDRIERAAAGQGVGIGQLLTAILDGRDRSGDVPCGRSGPESAAKPEAGGSAEHPAKRMSRHARQMEDALAAVQDAFRKTVREGIRQAESDRDEIRSLRDQLAAAEANAEKARENNREIQDRLTQLAAQLG